MRSEIVKPEKRNKCDYCDELAKYKVKTSNEPALYLCYSCYKDKKDKKN